MSHSSGSAVENFGDPDSHLTHSKASVVMYFFGFNESFAGDKGLAKFTEQMTRLVEETKAKDYGSRVATNRFGFADRVRKYR